MTEARETLFDARHLGDRIIGAHVVEVAPYDGPLVRIELCHRGTDDDRCYLIVGPSTVRFEDEPAGEA